MSLDTRPNLFFLKPDLDAAWYATYTLPRHEKRVAEQLAERSVEAYVPLYEAVRQWSDRRTRIQLPLFPCYLFVRISASQRVRVLELPGVVSIVSFAGRPAPLPDGEIERLRCALAVRKAQPYPYLVAGKRVRFRGGALDGLDGVILRRKGETRVVVSVDTIQRSFSIEADISDLQYAA